ncbi:cyclic beta 1-2 glucan synthetase [Taibaiella lutea]|uniref:Cyclic beta 1-2 glucan synthetase n=1 Tax=Taibaiella lutea TaxID=2608001 RepID=A0A5M6CJ84_9BACT|nr:glucoamylase family protein [Taibaiella lutea]KAA5535097.1 cyclic beta 1-2 glucan synthetase [Taibaiella lutea]
MSYKPNAGTVTEILSGLRKGFQYFYKTNEDGTQEPFRAELYSSGQLERHGKLIAASHKLMQHKVSDSLIKRLEENERKLIEVRNILVESIRTGKTITPAAEWLLDNFYLIEEQVILARKHLPKGYSEGLPHLSNGHSAGMPRVYDIVLEIIAHSDGRVDLRNLSSFIAAYQSETILTLGELWAIPIMLRLAVIENLRRVCSKIALDMIDNDLAEYWADKMMDTVKNAPADLIVVIADMARSKPELASPFVAGFTRKLQGHGPALALPLSWMEDQLTALGLSSNDLVIQESQKQAADQVSVRNCIGTLRFIGSNNWSEFVETLSSVEQTLRKDQTGIYPLMDFATRDRYRHVVEHIAKHSTLTETQVAEKALYLSSMQADETSRCAHVGYFLVDKGRRQTELACSMKLSAWRKFKRFFAKKPIRIYLMSILFFSLFITGCMWFLGFQNGIPDIRLTIILILLFLSGAAQLAVSLVNWLSTIVVMPQLLPRMDYSKNIPAEYRTLIIIPTMLNSMDYITQLVEDLEIRYLANPEQHLHYGLLTDYNDALQENMPEDEELLLFAQNQIEALNQKYNPEEQDTFFLFHRPRKWNAKEGKWMGYERKRGKLAALNALLRGRGQNEFISIIGQQEMLERIKYVITLDSDTQFPREAAWKLIATMAHPLNHAVYSPKLHRVTEGYGIMQPRVASAIPQGPSSLYLQMQGNDIGIDPYTRASSDVYQDLFNEGSFIGKGIYDVDIFEKAVHGAFQENRILSHDLLEGCYVRSGLLSDVLLYEENPTEYSVDIKRHHRWIRGDWQIGAWMLPFVTKENGKLTTNKLSLLSRWKIMDNLRRSLLPASLFILLLLGWTVLPHAWFWTLTITLILTLPVMVGAGWQLLHKPKDIKLKAHLSEVTLSVRDILLRFIFGITVLPYEAWIYMDAIIRTNWRMAISKRKLLQWTPSAFSSSRHVNIFNAYIEMWFIPFSSVAGTYLILWLNPAALIVAAPILLLWLFAPAIIWTISLPETEKDPGLNDAQYLFLHKTARKTWAYFETFVTETDNWLPPDNYQEEPVEVIAHRTSPTNIGLALLANLSAYDFGYISGEAFITRCKNTMDSMSKLERHKGHFYNWYDTLTRMPLSPRYISTVDSGNLIGHLLTLKQGINVMPEKPAFSNTIFDGINVCARIVKDYFKKNHKEIVDKIIAASKLKEPLVSLSAIKKQFTLLINLADELESEKGDQNEVAQAWAGRLKMQIKNAYTDLKQVLPWLEMLPLQEKFPDLSSLDIIPNYGDIDSLVALSMKQIEVYQAYETSQDDKNNLQILSELLIQAKIHAKETCIQISKLTEQCEKFSTVDYDFIFDKSTNLLRIGFNVDEQRGDDSFYDLLASEVRLGIFAGIAQGKLPQESWFALGRLLTNVGNDSILLSWSGSMFEYLMPQLVMPSYENTLLNKTNKATVKRQMDYAAIRSVPWGISESAYNAFDTALNYQYRAFGVPGLGLKRGLEEDLVIAPYASMMALMISPERACSNLQLMSREGYEGAYGFYEAIDFTPYRLPRDKRFEIIKSFMVHHQGMGFLSLAYLLLNKPMQQRFTMEPRFQATLLLLQEKVPRATVFYAHTAELIQKNTSTPAVPIRRIATPNTPVPEIQLLSNGRYQVMVSNSGGGYSRWKDLSLTRWREDGTVDGYGVFCYIKDVERDVFWSNTYQPTLSMPKNYEAVFSQGHVEFMRNDYGFVTKTEIVISPEDDIEMRRVRITNKGNAARTLEVTSYAEVVIAPQAADESHQAFSNLFVQTEINPQHKSIVCTRRPRSEGETPPWMFHLMDVQGVTVETVSYETDRLEFIGRCNTLADPKAMHISELSGKEGAVLDPILAIRHRFTIKPNQSAVIDMVYGVSDNKESCRAIMHKYKDQHMRRRALELSWTHNQVLLRQLNASETDVQLFNRLATSVVFANPALRTDPNIIKSNFRGQSGLWSHSVSGDLPIILLHIHDPENIELVRQMIQAHAYWRLKGLAVDLVIWNEDHGSYRQLLQDEITGMINTEMGIHTSYSKPGAIFVKSTDQISHEDRILFESVARVIISDNKGTLAEQVNRVKTEKALPPLLEKQAFTFGHQEHTLPIPTDLLFFNGSGGFAPDGKSYKIITQNNSTTPAPWVNVIANPVFGTVISETASAYTWAVNAHEYRLTPWNNDSVSDVGGEAFYIRDEVTGVFWSPAPFPIKGASTYITTHGFGYSTFEHSEQGLASEMSVFVDKDLPLKFITLKIRNYSGRERKITLTGFMEMILGDVRSKTNMHILSEYDTATGGLIFRNRYNSAFAEQVSFFSANGVDVSFTTDRAEFIGRNGTLKNPKALYQKKLSGRFGAGKDTCAALQSRFDLINGEEREIIFVLGSAADITIAKDYIQKFKTTESVSQSLNDVKAHWDEIIGSVKVSTPDKGLNTLANGWLLYQTIACRIYARSGFYQSGGAFGFRDQLQDVLAILHTAPSIAKEQILLSASRQFEEGDVQHWWHPPEGRGVRTRCSDDLLWLPFVTARYIKATGDKEILNSMAGFLESRKLHPGEDSLYDLPKISSQQDTIYNHCVRSIKHSLQFGEHGLPLIGSGDWNDGMDQVGHHGKGESVWLAFFFYDVLTHFEEIATGFGDVEFAATCKQQAKTLQSNIEANAWDGEWYLRAWFDNGTALGTSKNDECRIDAIAQSWSVISEAGEETRKEKAMASLDKYLVDRDLKLIKLLEPAFDKSALNPGYIKGYVPGVRENGGQYSHAAIWALMAFAKSGDCNKTYDLFNMIQPINHSLDAAAKDIYKVEPYVMAADVYANESHKGRGGWTWYTGSAGWMYQFILNSLLGLEREADELKFNPCFPDEWPSVEIQYRYGNAHYFITIINNKNQAVSQWEMDNEKGTGESIRLKDDGKEHRVTMQIRRKK